MSCWRRVVELTSKTRARGNSERERGEGLDAWAPLEVSTNSLLLRHQATSAFLARFGGELLVCTSSRKCARCRTVR